MTFQLVVQYEDTFQFSGHVQSRRWRSLRNLLKQEAEYLAFPFTEDIKHAKMKGRTVKTGSTMG